MVKPYQVAIILLVVGFIIMSNQEEGNLLSFSSNLQAVSIDKTSEEQCRASNQAAVLGDFPCVAECVLIDEDIQRRLAECTESVSPGDWVYVRDINGNCVDTYNEGGYEQCLFDAVYQGIPENLAGTTEVLCQDSDGGLNTIERGDTLVGGQSFRDACVAEQRSKNGELVTELRLVEHTCESGEITFNHIWCDDANGPGYACQEGRCVYVGDEEPILCTMRIVASEGVDRDELGIAISNWVNLGG